MIVRRTLTSLWPHRRRVGVALGQVAVLAGLELLKPWPLQIVIDSVLGGRAPIWAALQALSREHLLLAAAGGLVAIHILLGATSVWHNHTTISIGQALVNDLRGRLYAHLQRLSLSFHVCASVGDLIYRVTGDTYAIQTLAMNGIFPLVSAAMLLAGMTAVMLRLDVLLTGVALSVAPLLVIGIAWMDRRITAAAADMREKESAVFSLVQRNLAAIRVVQAFAREGIEQRRFLAGSAASLRSGLRLYTLQTVYGAAAGVLVAVGTAAVLLVGAGQVWRGHLSVGELVVFVSYLAALYAPLNSIVQTVGLAQGARAGLGRVFEILDGAVPVPDGSLGLPAAPHRRVEFEQVSFRYADGTLALADVSLRLAPGQCLAIVGATGAGKSTLVSLIPRFHDVSAGRVLIDGIDVRHLRLDSLRQQVGMVLQPPIVFPMTIHDNIAYGRPQATRAEVEAAARAAQADEFIRRLPAGYDALVGEQGGTLSEGERQRLTIARALLRDAPILILDEPTSALDATTEAALMNGLDQLLIGRTAIVIAHRLSTVRRATHVLLLDRGRVVEYGEFAELLAKGGPFARLYASQFEAGGG